MTMVNKSSRESSEIPILLSLKKMMIVFWLGREGAHETHREERALTLKSLTLSKKEESSTNISLKSTIFGRFWSFSKTK